MHSDVRHVQLTLPKKAVSVPQHEGVLPGNKGDAVSILQKDRARGECLWVCLSAAPTQLLHTEGDGQERQAFLGPANNETGHLHNNATKARPPAQQWHDSLTNPPA